MAVKIKGIKEVNPVQDLGAWGEIKKFHKTGMGKALIWGGVAGLAIKGALGYGLYKAGQSSGKRKQVKKQQPKKYVTATKNTLTTHILKQ